MTTKNDGVEVGKVQSRAKVATGKPRKVVASSMKVAGLQTYSGSEAVSYTHLTLPTNA